MKVNSTKTDATLPKRSRVTVKRTSSRLWTLLALVIMATSMTAQTTYYVDDVNAIKAMITANGLTGIDENDPSTWDFVTWNNDITDKRITELNVPGKSLTGTLDVSALTALTKLDCEQNQLTGITANTALKYLNCLENKLTTLDLSSNMALDELICSNNNDLTVLKLPASTTLKKLDCNKNKLTTLDVSSNTYLEVLNCSDNELTELKIPTYYSTLKELYCNKNQLTGTLDVSHNMALEVLNCSNNKLTKVILYNALNPYTFIDVSHNLMASDGDVSGYTVSSWDGQDFIFSPQDFTAVTGITGVPTDAVVGTSLTLSGTVAPTTATKQDIVWSVKPENVGTTNATVNNGELTATAEGKVVVTATIANGTAVGTPYIKDFTIYVNHPYNSDDLAAIKQMINDNSSLTGIDPNAHPRTWDFVTWNSDATGKQVTRLDVSGKGLTTLDVSALTALEDLNCSYNDLVALNVSNNPLLKYLYCNNNKLESINFLNNTVLEYLYCNNNKLTGLALSSTALTQLFCNNNELNGTLNVSNNADLKQLDCSNNKLGAINVSTNTKLTHLYCSNNKLIGTLDVSNNTALEVLNCKKNELTAINVLTNTNLTKLDCSSNKLSTLDVSKIQYLSNLNCSDNKQLGTLDVSKNQSLEQLYCSNNDLVALNVSSNQNLQILFCNDNKLSSTLDVSNNQNLGELNCSNNQLTGVTLNNSATYTSIDVSQNYMPSDKSTVTGNTSFTWGNQNFIFDPQNPVNAATPTISNHPQDATVNVGASVNLSVTASKTDNGTLSYQWYSNTTNINSGGSTISGATSASYSPLTATAGTMYYYVVVTNTNALNSTATETSNVAAVTVAVVQTRILSVADITFATAEQGYAQPAAQQVVITNSGNSAATVTSVTLTGSNFVVTGNSPQTVAANGGTNTAFSIRPKAGLAAGTHTATLTVTYDGAATATATVSFTVTVARYTLTLDTYNGSVSADQSSYEKGDEVILTVTPDDGYYLYSIDAYRSSGWAPVSLNRTNASTYTFRMPNFDVTVETVFREIEVTGTALYQTADPLTVRVVNTGNTHIDRYTLTLTGNDAESFKITSEQRSGFTPFTGKDLYVGDEHLVTLIPGDNLYSGIYSLTLTCSVSGAAPSSLSIWYRHVATSGNENITSGKLSAYTVSDRLHVSGLTPGKMWSVYNMSGILLYRGKAVSDSAEISLQGQGVLVVVSEGERVKVRR